MIDLNAKTIRKNKKIFLNYSHLRRKCAYETNPDKSSVAFEIIPALLSLNEQDLPGYVPDGEKVCGVYGFGTSKNIKTVINKYFPETRNKRIAYQRYLIKRPIIESLFLMGSIGTIAQNDKSDFDFWVCIDSQYSSGKNIDALFKKTERISRWCQSKFDMEVHFFIMNIEDIKRDDFGQVDEESAGSSQKTFLKEEFYRTLLLVSGKIPFWWVVPPETCRKDYERYWSDWVKKNSYDSDGFVDLGCLGKVPREEFLGTTLWHLSKGIKDPFKSLIKMTMMERYLSDDFKGPMLCDAIKKRVFEGPRTLKNTDPYLLMLEAILEFYQQSDKSNFVDLLRKAFYIKSQPEVTRLKLITRNNNYRIEIFNELMGKWGWSLDLCEDLNQIENWSYVRHLKFSAEINLFFFSFYKRLRKVLAGREKQSINDHDLTLLGRKLYVLFAKRKNKLQLTPFINKDRLILEKCVFRLGRNNMGNQRWVLYDATKYPFEEPGKKSIIYTSSRVTRTAAWLVINGLFDFYKTSVEMPPNSSDLNVNDLIELLKHIQGFFLPPLHQVKMGANLQNNPKHNQIMMVVNLERETESENSANTDLIYNNTWGELFIETYPLQKALSVLKTVLQVEDTRKIISRVRVHIPRSTQSLHNERDIYNAIMPNP